MGIDYDMELRTCLTRLDACKERVNTKAVKDFAKSAKAMLGQMKDMLGLKCGEYAYFATFDGDFPSGIYDTCKGITDFCKEIEDRDRRKKKGK